MSKFIIALTAVILVSFGAMAQQTRCGEYDRMKDILAAPPFEEQVQYLGSLGEIGAIEIWINHTTGTFTLVGRPTDRPELGCLIGGGSGWKNANAPKHIPGRARDGRRNSNPFVYRARHVSFR